MNDSLIKLYLKYWDEFIQNEFIPCSSSTPCAYPFLIKVTQKYENSSKRIMICGQETQGWGRQYYNSPSTTSVYDVLKKYDDFVNKQDSSGLSKPGYTEHSSPYWNFIWQIMRSFPEVGFVQNNIVKVGKAIKHGCDDEINVLTQKHFPVFMNELEILRPTLIIFLTGNYDKRIKSTLGDFSTEHIGDIDACFDILTFNNLNIPKAIRINHPGWLQRNKLYNQRKNELIEVINKIL